MSEKISVVVTVYATEKYLETCLKSIKLQTHKNLEVIVVNDGSKGNVKEIFDRVADSRFIYVDNICNKGLFLARIAGAKVATGDYIAFVDSDDYVDQDYYRLLLRTAREHSADITFAMTVEDIENKGIYERVIHREIIENGFDDSDDACRQFLSYEGSCYALHTIWNKLYKKPLFDRCLPYYEQMNEHIIMTEDIAFSVPLFYYAKKVAVSAGSIYYYCRYAGSSTDNRHISVAKYEKNLKDMRFVFNFAEKFLVQAGADEDMRKHMSQFRLRYKKMWEAQINSSRAEVVQRRMRDLIDWFDDRGTEGVKTDFGINNVMARWEDKTPYLKKQIRWGKYKYISFDIFDTLVQRPFYRPTDLFMFLDRKFKQLTDANINFYEIRVRGEELARRYYGEKCPEYKDITLDEIYEYISVFYGLDEKLCQQLKEEERRLETEFSAPRNWAKQIYDFTVAVGKPVVLISDMYLDADIVEKILEKNGYREYKQLFLSSRERCLKSDGSLFEKAVKELEVTPGDILHIGDNWNADRMVAQSKGLQTFFAPKSINVFENVSGNYKTNQCASIAGRVCGTWIDYEKVRESTGYGAMLAMVANKYFSNPFRALCENSDFNKDPYLVGYYLVGMHLVGVNTWLHNLLRKRKYDRIVFTARDGYLYKKVYDISRQYYEDKTDDIYLYLSRKAMMPMIVKGRMDLFDLPIQFQAYSPLTMRKLLTFCSREVGDKEYESALDDAGIDIDRVFPDKKEYHTYIHWFIDNYYDETIHMENQDRVKKYFSGITKEDLFFDMGYSGRIQKAVCDCVGYGVDVAFIHQDTRRSFELSGAGNFRIYSYYDMAPCMSDFLREYILSEIGSSCIGYDEMDGKAVPVFETFYDEKVSFNKLRLLQKGAIQFARDFYALFGEWLQDLSFKPLEVSLPFEGFLRHASLEDMDIFDEGSFEDEIYGRQKEISVKTLALQQRSKYGW